MNAGGACIGCTMPGFPDKFTPFYKIPPGSRVSTTASRLLGSFIRPLRSYTNSHLNRETRWDLHGDVPTAWARERGEPSLVHDLGHKFYDRMRRSNDTGRKSKNDEELVFGKRVEFTQDKRPEFEQEQEERVLEKTDRGIPQDEES